MMIHRDINLLPAFKNAAITIGSFDGVHTGHQKIIEQLKQEAEKINGETVIITFHPHPKTILHPSQHVHLLTTLPEKIELLRQKNIDHLVIVPFNETFAGQAPEVYMRNFLFDKFHPHTIIIGYDHRFGKDRKGDYHLMEKYADEFDFKLKEIPEYVLNEVIISSTRIREALQKADIETANKFLGYTYFFEGIVVKGGQRGKTIGYPTANMYIEHKEKLIPANGVYAVKVGINNHGLAIGSLENSLADNIQHPTLNIQHYNGMMNIGVRPTVDGTYQTIEVNIFDFNENIYGKKLRVYVKKFLRYEEKFSGLDALKEQLAKDKIAAINELAN